MRKQLLWLMYIFSKEDNLLRIAARETRNASKIVFKVPHRISPIYEKSPFSVGTKLWDDLRMEVQHVKTVFDFKREIGRNYRKYEDLL